MGDCLRAGCCDSPDSQRNWRKWSVIGGVKFAPQCLECKAQIGKPVHPRDVPLDVDAGACLMAEIDFKAERAKRGPTGMGGKGNSKRRAYDAYMRSARWRGPNGVREYVLERDKGICQDCGAKATCVAHRTYPRDIRDTRPEHCKASCNVCNQAEREERLGGSSGGS